MSLKKSQEYASYMDAVSVKIAEEYKPPPKINTLMTHSQRLKFNTQVKDNQQNYDFFVENDILQRVREWKSSRLMQEKQRKVRLKEFNENKEAGGAETEEKFRSETVDITSTSNNSEVVSTIGSCNISTYSNGYLLSHNAINHDSDILQPIPSKSHCQEHKTKNLEVTSAFNLSEFEADTSSPFDSVALKSINDVEELAKVLKIEEAVPANTSTCTNYQVKFEHQTPNQFFHNYSSMSDLIPSSFSNHNTVTTGTSIFHDPEIRCWSEYNTKVHGYSSSSKNIQGNHPYDKSKFNAEKKSELLNVETYQEKQSIISGNNFQAIRTYNKVSNNLELTDIYDELPEHLQNLSRSISSMGFPLQRVARTCKIFGDDNKKVVDHLLAISELLDLGFSEDEISEALLVSDNDRDKALDKLIS